MARKQQLSYPIDEVFRFPYHRSVEEYTRVHGAPPPPFDPNRPVCYYADPNAQLLKDWEQVTYYHVPIVQPGGSTVERRNYTFPAAWVRSVNIPDTRGQLGDLPPGRDYSPLPCPIVDLYPDEELRVQSKLPSGNAGLSLQDNIIVVNLSMEIRLPSGGSGLTPDQEAILDSIHGSVSRIEERLSRIEDLIVDSLTTRSFTPERDPHNED